MHAFIQHNHDKFQQKSAFVPVQSRRPFVRYANTEEYISQLKNFEFLISVFSVKITSRMNFGTPFIINKEYKLTCSKRTKNYF